MKHDFRFIGIPWRFLLLALSLCTIAGPGCHSTKPKSEAERFAFVELHGNTPGQISEAACEVFRAHGYTVARANRTQMVFEKKGSALNNLAYGSWLGDNPVFVRVKAAIVPIGEATWRLQCEGFTVQDHGSANEEELRISNLRAHTYQKLLEEVAQRLKPKPDAG